MILHQLASQKLQYQYNIHLKLYLFQYQKYLKDLYIPYKIVLIGDVGTGKSCMVCQYVTGKICPHNISTIGIEMLAKSITNNDKSVELQIWDTSGQERYRAITQAHYQRAIGMVAIYDITRRVVSVEAAQGFAKEHGMEYMEISALNQEECENVFVALTKQMEANKQTEVEVK